MVLLRTNMTLTGTIFCVTAFPLVGISGTICNYLLCAAIYNTKHLRTFANSLIFSLSVANMLVCSVTSNVAILSLFVISNQGLIAVMGETTSFCVMSALLHLAVISFENYSYVFHPSRRLTYNYITCIIPCIWIVAFIYTLLVVVLRQFVTVWLAGCHFIWYFVTTSIIVVCYVLVLRKLKQHRRHFSIFKNYTQARRRIDAKTTHMILVLAAILTLNWLPAISIYTAFIMTYHNTKLSDTFREPFNMLLILAYAGHAFMPLVYAYYNSKFRRAMKKELAKKRQCFFRKSKTQVRPVLPSVRSQ